jgi:hypothetical protein
MTQRAPVLRKVLLASAIFMILLCPALFVMGRYFPASLGFLEPALCPPGMQLGSTTESLSDPRGNVTASFSVCTDGREEVDATGRLLMILFGVAILGAVLLVAWALSGPAKEPDNLKLKPE